MVTQREDYSNNWTIPFNINNDLKQGDFTVDLEIVGICRLLIKAICKDLEKSIWQKPTRCTPVQLTSKAAE